MTLYTPNRLWPSLWPHGIGLLLPLVTAHLIGDFVLQTDAMAAAKRRPSVLLAHAALHGLLALLLVGNWSAWPVIVAVMLSHSLIDRAKEAFERKGPTSFIVDQALHLAAILLIGFIGRRFLETGCWIRVLGPFAWRCMAVASGAILCVQVTAFLVGYWVRPYLQELKPGDRGLTNGGRAIGQWERALIFLFVLTGQPGAVGFLVAAKSIFRFGELKDPENRREAEYITIGTLMSFGTALVWSLATLFLLRHLR